MPLSALHAEKLVHAPDCVATALSRDMWLPERVGACQCAVGWVCQRLGWYHRATHRDVVGE